MPKERGTTSIRDPGVTATQIRHDAYARPYGVSTGVKNTCSPDGVEKTSFPPENGEFGAHGAGHAVVFHSPTGCLIFFHHLAAVIVHNRAGSLTLIWGQRFAFDEEAGQSHVHPPQFHIEKSTPNSMQLTVSVVGCDAEAKCDR